MLAQAFAHFVDGEHAGANVNVVNLGLLQRVQGAVLLPDKLNIAEAEVARHDEVDGVCQIAEYRNKTFRGGLFHAGLSRGAVHYADKLLRRETKRITNDAGVPFVERILEHGIARELKVAAPRNEGDATASSRVSCQRAVKPFLKCADLVSRPLFGNLCKRFSHIALSVVIQQLNQAAK